MRLLDTIRRFSLEPEDIQQIQQNPNELPERIGPFRFATSREKIKFRQSNGSVDRRKPSAVFKTGSRFFVLPRRTKKISQDSIIGVGSFSDVKPANLITVSDDEQLKSTPLAFKRIKLKSQSATELAKLFKAYLVDPKSILGSLKNQSENPIALDLLTLIETAHELKALNIKNQFQEAIIYPDKRGVLKIGIAMTLQDGYELFEHQDVVECWNFQKKLHLAILILEKIKSDRKLGITAHCDIKPENMILTGHWDESFESNEAPSIELVDYGFAHFFDDILSEEPKRYGTSPFMPPEVELQQLKKESIRTWQAHDVYAAALVIAEFFYYEAKNLTKDFNEGFLDFMDNEETTPEDYQRIIVQRLRAYFIKNTDPNFQKLGKILQKMTRPYLERCCLERAIKELKQLQRDFVPTIKEEEALPPPLLTGSVYSDARSSLAPTPTAPKPERKVIRQATP